MREIKLTNSLTHKKEILKPRVPGKLSFYSCGPTVYGLIHIGNLRAALVADMMFRWFQKAGYEVNFVRNYTDVDDKIIKKANDEGTTSDVISKRYTLEVERDYSTAGLLKPTHTPLVTETMPEIIAMIGAIIRAGKAYVVDGEVLFAIDQFPGYGKLSHKKIDELVAGARVEVNQKKRNPLDFSLWKPAKPGEPFWESPWGKGRPGWHIECSAMSGKLIGDQIDVHHGGEDLIFPHHENEIAQSESASGKAPFVGVWVHNAFLTLSKEKMSKSLGNVFSAREFLSQYSGELARYLLLSVHYRSIIDFSEETIEGAIQGLHRIYEAKQRAVDLKKSGRVVADPRGESLWGGFVADVEKAKAEILDAYANDLNTAGALGVLFTLIREFNRILAEPFAAATPSVTLGANALIGVIESEIGDVLGIGKLAPADALADLRRIADARAKNSGNARPSAEEVASLLAERVEARKAKNFARSDEIRKELETRGVVIKDSPQGTTWEYRV